MKSKSSLRATILAGSIAALLAAPAAHAATFYWDANAATAGRTDGAGAWLGTDQWWTGSANTTWVSGSDAVFGYSTAGGAVTLASPTTVGSLTFNPFSGTYTLGTAGQAITLNSGITKNSGAGVVTIVSALVLGGAQTWTNTSTSNINIQAGTTLNGDLTFDGIGSFDFTNTNAVIKGSGKLIKNGAGHLVLSAGGTAPVHTFTGDIEVNGGSIGFQASAFLGGRNTHLTNGYLGGRFGSGFTWSGGLGTGANQIQITGVSGFSGEGNSGSTFIIGGAGSTLKWGASGENGATGFFNPTALFLNGDARMNAYGQGSLNNAIDLNGGDRTFTSNHTNWDGASGTGFTISGAITNTAGTAAGIIRTGVGNLSLIAANTYNGATTINGGTLTLRTNGTSLNTTALNLGGGILRLVNTANTQRFADVAVSVTAGGGITYENTSGVVNYTESLGALTLTKGQVNVVLTTDQVGAGSQKLTFGTSGTGNLTQGGGNGTITFSAAGAGLDAAKNTVAVFGETATAAGGIIGPWATVGTAANVQTAFAAHDASGFVVAAVPTVAAVDTDLASSTENYDINTGSAFTLAATRTVNAVQFRGAASALDLATFKLETNGFFFSGGASNGKTITGTGAGALTTPSGGGNLYITSGQVMVATNEHKINAPITDNSGTVHLVKSGSGILHLNGANTFTGNIDINAGTLRIGTNATANGANLNSGTYAGDIFIAAGANLDFQTNANQTLSGEISGDGNLLKRYIGTLTLSGANTYTGKTTLGAITNAGSPTLVVSSFNSVSNPVASSSLGRPTTVANGTIEMGSANSTPNPTLRYVGTGETTDRIINITFNSSATRTLDASNLSGLLKFTSPFTSTGLSTGQLALTGTGAGEIASLPFLFGNLTKSGNGTWTLGGPSGSVGLVSISAGTLIATDPRALGADIGNLATTGPTIGGSGTLSLRNDSSVTFGVANTGYNINNSASGATINVDRVSGTGPNTISVGNLTTTSTAGSWQLNFTGANGVSLNAGTLTAPLSTAATTHTINNNIATTNNASLTLASISAPSTNAAPVLEFSGSGNTIVTGAITQATAALAVRKIGTGTLTLSGNNTYTGTTNINDGTLKLGIANALPTTTALTILADGIIDLASFNQAISSLSSGSVDAKVTNSAAAAGTATLTSNQTTTTTYAGVIEESGGLSTFTAFALNGSGTLNLSGNNTYRGGTIVSAGTLTGTGTNSSLGATTGTLQVSNPNLGVGTNVVLNLSTVEATTTGSLSGTIAPPSGGTNTATINNGGQTYTVNQTTADTFAGNIAGAGGFTLGSLSTNTLTVSGSNTYTGTTTVDASTLEVTGSLSGTTAVNVNSGGTLLLNNNVNDIVNTAATMSVAGGTVRIANAVDDRKQNLGSLVLSGVSILDFGGGANGNTMSFSSLSFTGTKLNIYNWSGSAYGAGVNDTGSFADTQDRLLFTNDTIFTGAEDNRIEFFSDGGGISLGFGQEVLFGSQFELVPITPVPEPATTALIGAVALCALFGYRERRRFSRESGANSAA